MWYFVKKIEGEEITLRYSNIDIVKSAVEVANMRDTVIGFNKMTGKLAVKTLVDVCNVMRAKYKLMNMNLANLSIGTESSVDKHGFVRTTKVYLIASPYVSYIKGDGKDKPHRITLSLVEDAENYATDLKIDWGKIFRDYIATVKPEDCDLCELYFDMPLLEKGFVEQFIKWSGEVLPKVIISNVVFTENFNMNRVRKGYYSMFLLEENNANNTITYVDTVKIDLSRYECSIKYNLYSDTSDRVIQPKRQGETK